jgi:hypothetical protein
VRKYSTKQTPFSRSLLLIQLAHHTFLHLRFAKNKKAIICSICEPAPRAISVVLWFKVENLIGTVETTHDDYSPLLKKIACLPIFAEQKLQLVEPPAQKIGIVLIQFIGLAISKKLKGPLPLRCSGALALLGSSIAIIVFLLVLNCGQLKQLDNNDFPESPDR